MVIDISMKMPTTQSKDSKGRVIEKKTANESKAENKKG